MPKFLRRLFLCTILIFSMSSTALAMPEILSFKDLRNGMSGKAYTVVDDSGEIKNFDVNIIGFSDEGKGAKRTIIAHASGDLVQRTHGILQGMSGSPVYVDGKLIGAVASTLKGMDPFTVFITPIEDMIELWELPDPKAEVNHVKAIKLDEESSAENSEDNTTSAPPEKIEQITPETEKDTKEVSSFYVDGFNSSGLNFLSQQLGLNNLQTAPKKVDRGVNLNATLEAGSPIGVAIIYGDFSLGATGTVTAVDGKKILAFGHSFTHSGNVNYFMTDASVIGAVSGVTSNGVKLAGIGNIIGRVNQDRDAGISGILGTFPAVVPVNVTVKDNALNKQETFNASIAYNENLTPKLGAAITYTALNKMADTLAESSVEIEFNIKTDAVDSGEITRENMFYNAADVGQVAVVELMQALSLVCSNTTQESNIFDVDVNISFDMERRTASIVSITPEKTKVKPSETVNLKVSLQPYRKPIETRIIPYTVPLNALEGDLTLELHGGTISSIPNKGNADDTNKSYADKIKDFLKSGRNNQLVIERVNSVESNSKNDVKRATEQSKRLKERFKKEGKTFKTAATKIDTPYIIDNFMRTSLSVEKI